MAEDFSGLGLSAKVTEAVAAAGYTKPTDIQAQAIPHVLEKKDIIGNAQTGTGTTASVTFYSTPGSGLTLTDAMAAGGLRLHLRQRVGRRGGQHQEDLEFGPGEIDGGAT